MTASAPEGPFRVPERLALVLSPFAVVGLILVAAAAAAGEPAPIVALVGVVALGVCALAPIALVEIYVARPLRAMLAHLRAARDGHETFQAPPGGVIGDLVAVARDIRAGQASAERLNGALSVCERSAADGDRAMQTLRRQCEEWAAASASSAQSHRAEMSETLQALKLDGAGAGERVETALAHLLERVGRRDDDAASDRLEKALADLAELVRNETRSLQDGVASAAQSARDDSAAAAGEYKAAEGREASRLEALEARIVARLSATEPANLAEWLQREQETTRQALLAGIAEGEAKSAATFTRTTERLRNAIDRLDALSASAATAAAAQNDELQAALRAAEGEIASLGAKIEAARDADGATNGWLDALEGITKRQNASVLARLDASAAAWEAHASELTLAASVDAQTLAALRSDIATVKARVAEIAPRAAATAEALAERLLTRFDAFDATALQPAARDLAEAQARSERHADEIAASAAVVDALAQKAAPPSLAIRSINRLNGGGAGGATAASQGGPLDATLSDLARKLAASH